MTVYNTRVADEFMMLNSGTSRENIQTFEWPEGPSSRQLAASISGNSGIESETASVYSTATETQGLLPVNKSANDRRLGAIYHRLRDLRHHVSTRADADANKRTNTLSLPSSGSGVPAEHTGKESSPKKCVGVKELTGHRQSVQTVAFSQDGKQMASGSRDTTARLWDQSRGVQVKRILDEDAYRVGPIHSIAFSPDGRLLATGVQNVTLWDIARQTKVATFGGYKSDVLATAISADTLAMAFSPDVLAVAFSPDGKLLASADKEMVRFWDATGAEAMKSEGHSKAITTLAFSRDGALVASGSKDATVRIWDPVSGAEVRILEGHQDTVTAVAFSPDGESVVSGSRDGTIHLWNLATGTANQFPVGGEVYCVTFSPDGMLVAFGGLGDTAVRLWDPVAGEVVHRLEGHSKAVNAVAFSPDGRSLLSGSADKTARLWHLAVG